MNKTKFEVKQEILHNKRTKKAITKYSYTLKDEFKDKTQHNNVIKISYRDYDNNGQENLISEFFPVKDIDISNCKATKKVTICGCEYDI